MNICIKIAEVDLSLAYMTHDHYTEAFDNQILHYAVNRAGHITLVLFVEFETEADAVIFLLTYNDQLNQIK